MAKRAPKVEVAPTPPPPQAALRSIVVGRKTYEVGGGVNAKGPFVLLTEKVGRRNSYIYIPSEHVAEFVGMMTLAAAEVTALVPAAPPEESGVGGPE